MDNIQLCYIDNEINKIDKMKQGDVIYKNGMELLVVLSYDHNEPCKGCFFYKNKACGSEKLIKCWDCKKEYIFTAIRKYNTTELCGIVKRYELENTLRAWKRITGSTNLYCKKDWRNFPTQPPVCRRNDGLPFDVDYLTIPYNKWRKESIKAYGNAIIPKIAYKFF